MPTFSFNPATFGTSSNSFVDRFRSILRGILVNQESIDNALKAESPFHVAQRVALLERIRRETQSDRLRSFVTGPRGTASEPVYGTPAPRYPGRPGGPAPAPGETTTPGPRQPPTDGPAPGNPRPPERSPLPGPAPRPAPSPRRPGPTPGPPIYKRDQLDELDLPLGKRRKLTFATDGGNVVGPSFKTVLG